MIIATRRLLRLPRSRLTIIYTNLFQVIVKTIIFPKVYGLVVVLLRLLGSLCLLATNVSKVEFFEVVKFLFTRDVQLCIDRVVEVISVRVDLRGFLLL